MQNKYPLWKNLLLILIAVVGFIYAIPNLYTENPVVQISAQNSVDMDQLQNQVEKILNHKKLAYTSVINNEDSLEVVFKSTDAQLVARDEIKNALGNQYTVALNLAPATPNWLDLD